MDFVDGPYYFVVVTIFIIVMREIRPIILSHEKL